jgi:hypothetical protein
VVTPLNTGTFAPTIHFDIAKRFFCTSLNLLPAKTSARPIYTNIRAIIHHLSGPAEDAVSIEAIRETIGLAIQHEDKTRHLAQIFEDQADQLHMAVQLPEDNSVSSLVEFVIAYTQHVPNFLEAAWGITKTAKLEYYAAPILQLAEDFFLKPPEIIDGHIGLEELMDEAYLAHRLMEEVNDRFMMKAGIPLVPMDMTMSNLIIHNLIGEPFANQLDEAVRCAVESLMIKQHVYSSEPFKAYVKAHRGDHWERELKRWPCLTDKLSINLQFSGLNYGHSRDARS